MKKQNVKFKEKSQVTIPKSFVSALGLEKGDTLQCYMEDGKIVFEPALTVSKDQLWFWSQEWQAGEKEADNDIKNGFVKEFESVHDLIAELESE